MKKNKSWMLVLGIIVIIVAFFAWARISDPEAATVKAWNQAGVDCINEGVTVLGQHIHPQLRIFVNGREELIPANTGLVRSCTTEVHTHTDLPNIHVESGSATKVFRLKDFFAVWGKTIERPGFTLVMQVDGKPSNDLGEHVLVDQEHIELRYTSSAATQQ